MFKCCQSDVVLGCVVCSHLCVVNYTGGQAYVVKRALVLLGWRLDSYLLRVQYRGLQEYTWVYIAIQGFRGVYMGIQEYTWVYMRIQGYTGVYMGVHENTGVYRSIHGYT